MPDRRRDEVALATRSGTSRSGDTSLNGDTEALTAAAQLLTHGDLGRPVQYESWQEEGWGFYDNLGEFNYGVEWFGEAMSRVRLTAAKVTPGGDEPEIIDTGPAAEIVNRFMGGTDGQAQFLRSTAVQLAVPGEAFLVGRQVTEFDEYTGVLLDAEPDEDGNVWTVQPVNTMRRSHKTISEKILGHDRRRRGWDIQVDDARWITLPTESLVCRIWDRHEHFPWRAMSPTKAALPIMREVDMYNRYIVATLLSRVALNGIFFIPDEVTLPVNPNYAAAGPNAFVAELLDIMRNAIKNPGSPSSVAPLPLRVKAEFIEKFKHFTFATPLDDKIWQSRGEALKRLATTLNLPQEVLTGMGEVNHWGQWQLTEDAIKTHLSPKAEIITRCLTIGYLRPMLRAMNDAVEASDGSRIIVWYDTSELTQRPDRSDAALRLREMLVINDDATRRETGFDEADAPSDDELEKMVLMKLAVNPQTAGPALKALTGLELEFPPPAPVAGAPSQPSGPAGDVGSEPPQDSAPQAPATGPPEKRDSEPPPPDE